MTIKFGEFVPGPKSNSISRLIGARLSSVNFAGPSLIFYQPDESLADEIAFLCFHSTAVIQTKAGRFTYEQPGYADAFVRLIRQKVVDAGSTYESGIRIVFDGGSIVTLFPTKDQTTSPDLVTLNGFKDWTWVAWRDGDFAYADE